MMARAQLSLVIIIGLVVLVMFAIGYAVVGGKEPQRAVVANRERVAPVQQFVDGCLRVSASKSLDALGKQGGVLLASQGGLTPDTDLAEGETMEMYEDHPVRYALFAPYGQVGNLFFSEPPDYPWKKFPEWTVGSVPGERYEGYFGIERLPALNGSSAAVTSVPSMEMTTEAAIAAAVDTCMDWSQLSYLGMAINATQSVVDVSFNEEDTIVVLNTSVRVAGDGTDATLGPFVLRLPLRMKKVCAVAKAVLGNDGNDITAKEDYAQDGIMAVVKKDVGTPGNDLVTFIDSKGMLEGAPFEFRVMRQDRPPALKFIGSPTGPDLCPGAKMAVGHDSVSFDARACENGKGGDITSIAALDPDDDAYILQVKTVGGGLAREEQEYTISMSDITFPALQLEVHAIEQDGPHKEDWQVVSVPASKRKMP